jgi:IclR family acetate operon transcriptional repressor
MVIQMPLAMPPPGSCGRPRSIRSVARALHALEVLFAEDELGLVEVARRLDLPASSTHRLLATLSGEGWVTQSPRTGRYLISPRMLGLAARLHERTGRLRAAARPYLERARKVSGAAAQLAVLDRADVVYLDEVQASGVGGPTAAGQAVPAHASGPGKALLAQIADDRLAILRSPGPYERRTERTITSPDALRRELATIRRLGYAVDDEEQAAGVACVAAPVFAAAGEPVAAISVCGAAAEMRDVGLRELGEFLVILTGELSRELGGGGGA